MQALWADLDAEQQKAVTLPVGHALILAGAGSGKTRVLTRRIAWLIAEEKVDPLRIWAMTFSNKAAREMRERLEPFWTGHGHRPWVGTFHAVAHRLLRLHAEAVGLAPTFQILDAQDQLALIKRLLKRLNVNEHEVQPRELAAFINHHKERGVEVGSWIAENARAARLQELWYAYEEQCAREQVLDFAELLVRALALLEKGPLQAAYRSRVAHLLIDEFQDTNPLQYRIVQALAAQSAEEGAWVFAVGDDDQSIYGFRGAMPEVLAAFLRDYRAQLIRLERNYRSAGNILAVANAVIAHNASRIGKTLWTARSAGEPIRVFEAEDEEHEARLVVTAIEQLIKEGAARSEIAILYRANALSRTFEHQLFAADIPYRIYGGMRFYERAEVKTALAYLRLLVHPDDEGAFVRAAQTPSRGIGAKTLEALLAAHAQGLSWEQAVDQLSSRSREAVRSFLALLAAMRQEVQQLPLAQAIEYVLQSSGLWNHFRSELGERAEDACENLQALIAAGDDFIKELLREGEAATGLEALGLFLRYALLEAERGSEEANAVSLMTIHAAKGLEFNTVFLVGLEDGLFPHEQAAAEPSGLEEERRLFYVAVTRARERLFLSYARMRRRAGGSLVSTASRFLAEVPEELLLWPSPRRLRSAAKASESFAPKGVQRWYPGQRVLHAKFGEGVILRLFSEGARSEAVVRFRAAGEKRLILELAPLEPLGV